MNTRSKKTDGPKVLREMFEECEAGRWEAAARTRVNTVEEVIVGEVPQIVTQGLHQLNSEDLVKLTSKWNCEQVPSTTGGTGIWRQGVQRNSCDRVPGTSSQWNSVIWRMARTDVDQPFFVGLDGMWLQSFSSRHQDTTRCHRNFVWRRKAVGVEGTRKPRHSDLRAGQAPLWRRYSQRWDRRMASSSLLVSSARGRAYTSPMVGLTVSSRTARRVSCWLTVFKLSIEEKELEERYKELSHHAAVGIRRGDVAGSSRWLVYKVRMQCCFQSVTWIGNFRNLEIGLE